MRGEAARNFLAARNSHLVGPRPDGARLIESYVPSSIVVDEPAAPRPLRRRPAASRCTPFLPVICERRSLLAAAGGSALIATSSPKSTSGTGSAPAAASALIVASLSRCSARRVSRIELKLAEELIFKTVALAAHKLCTMNEAKSDLINVLSSLEAHWHVLEAEVVEINRDIEYCEQCLRKYGEWFNSPLQYLRELKRTKKNKMKEIIRTMESFNNNLQGGKKLVKSLEKQSPVSVLQAPATPAVIATGASVRRLPAAPPTAHAHAHAAARPQMPPSTLYSRPMLQG